MAKIYYRKISNEDTHLVTGQLWTINDVPERWKTEVQELLDGSTQT